MKKTGREVRLAFSSTNLPTKERREADQPANLEENLLSSGWKSAFEPDQKIKLYNYWRSTCSQTVRITLNLKEYEKLNPVKYVPTLVDGEVVVADSFAIILYLEDKYPQHPLLPKDLKKKALNIQIASIVTSTIQPRQNLPVDIDFIEGRFDLDKKLLWAQHYLNKGFTALEKLIKDCAGKYATGDEIQMADVFLEPQIHAGITRFEIDMSEFPTLARLHDAYMKIPEFQAAVPEIQQDAPRGS
ncbi:hypothetical protein LUZ61_007231 [Rhynchospora tenuis]|uniref:Glutathione transferase n=1 Tax=Rhynchospora tenuis TaxID=198213 RepID=A0AAD6EWC0_9POAL|nr:hypothetical protein LUZ61_007231 [Rhynchospora tenuis]